LVSDLQATIDKQEIVDLTIAYCRALDELDWGLLGSCFTEDGVLDVGPWGVHEGKEAIVALCSPLFPGMDRTQHLVGNHVISITGDEAQGTCYLVAEHLLRTLDGGGDQTTTRGRYHDSFVRTQDGWRIRSRRLEIIWREGNISIFDQALARTSAGYSRQTSA
jgi:hypothetical protein